MLASTSHYVTESMIQSVASELVIKDLVNTSFDTQSIYSSDYSLKKQFEDIKQRTQSLIDNLNPEMLKQYEILLECFKTLGKNISNYELFKKRYMTYLMQVKSEKVISEECAAYLYFLHR